MRESPSSNLPASIIPGAIQNAIAVLDPRTEALYGYVNKGFAARLAKRIDAGEEFAAFAMGRGGVTVAMMPVPVARELGLLRRG